MVEAGIGTGRHHGSIQCFLQVLPETRLQAMAKITGIVGELSPDSQRYEWLTRMVMGMATHPWTLLAAAVRESCESTASLSSYRVYNINLIRTFDVSPAGQPKFIEIFYDSIFSVLSGAHCDCR